MRVHVCLHGRLRLFLCLYLSPSPCFQGSARAIHCRQLPGSKENHPQAHLRALKLQGHQVQTDQQVSALVPAVFLMHGGCPPAGIAHKRPDHGQVNVHGEPKFIEGQ